MIMDGQLLFDQAMAVTASRASTNQIDLSQARDLGPSDLMLFAFWVTPPAAPAGATINAALQGTNDSTLQTWTTIQESGPQLVSNFTAAAGIMLEQRVGAEAFGPYRYLQLVYTASATLTQGAITAGLNLQAPRHPNYARNFVA